MKETALVKGIHMGMYPHMICKRGDKVDALTPYKSFKFVFVVPEGRTAAKEMSLTLREWTQLCHSLSSDKALSVETKALFRRYTGRSADDNMVVDEQKATSRFIHIEVLETRLRDSTAFKKNKSSVQEESTSTAASRTDIDARSNIKLTCIGLKNVRIQKYVAYNPEYGVLYCQKRWAQFRGAWRDKKCSLEEDMSTGDNAMTWTKYSEGWQCKKCNDAKSNIRQARHPELFTERMAAEDTATAEGGSNIPDSNTLKGCVVALYRQCGAKDVVINVEMKEIMQVLRCREIFAIDCGDGMKVFLCPGFEGDDCSNIDVVKAQNNNSDLCSCCQIKSKQTARTERRRVDNKEFRLDPTSTMQQCNRTKEELSAVTKKVNYNRKIAKTRLQQVEANLAATIIKFEGESTEFIAFRAETEKKLRDICGKEKDNFRASARAALIEVMKEGLKEEKEDPDAKFEEKDIDGILNFIVDELQNTLKDLAGKKNQKQYSALTMQLAYSDWSRSQAGYRATLALTPLARPSMRTMQRHQAQTMVRDGICTKAYEIRFFTRTAAAAAAYKAAAEVTATTHPPTANAGEVPRERGFNAGEVPKERGVVYVDEMKLKEEIAYSSTTHEPVGMANDTIDIKKIMKRIIAGEKDEMKSAVYVNQWRYKNLATCEAFNVEFWFNDGKMSPETLFRQFLQVLFSLELIGCEVRGICLDAGGSNARFTRLLRQVASLGDAR
jgi:hypothetical protein